MKKWGFIVTLVLFTSISYAQTQMKVEDAIRIGLEHNYEIQIARNTAAISDYNTGKGTAGFLPSVEFSANYTVTQSGEEGNSSQSLDESTTRRLSARVNLNWTVFDGFRMFINRDRYRSLAQQSEYQLRATIENMVVAISRAYFDLVQQSQLLEVAQSSLAISQERLDKITLRNALGGASTSEVLQAQVALNADQTAVWNQELQVEIARKNLNVLLGRHPQTPVMVENEIEVPVLNLTLAQLLERATARNSSLQIARQGLQVARHDAGLAASTFYPRLSFSGGYTYTDFSLVSDELPVDTETTTNDLSVGLVLSYTIFNGFQHKIDWQNAKIQARNAEMNLMDVENQLQNLVEQTYDAYQTRIDIVSLETENVAVARRNLQLVQDRYELGTVSALDFRDAQVSLSRAQTALIGARYQARMTYLELEQLTGNITFD
ncbi:MAG: TolC family protein [Gemmatimonadetes bacterium]|nr:MAG: TolC family protein [Gemmatimonadota bacterium]